MCHDQSLINERIYMYKICIYLKLARNSAPGDLDCGLALHTNASRHIYMNTRVATVHNFAFYVYTTRLI